MKRWRLSKLIGNEVSFLKKHLSVFGLFIQSSIYKILTVLLLMTVAEASLFHFQLRRALAQAEAIGKLTRLEDMIGNSYLGLCFALAFVLISIILCCVGTEYFSKCGYTLKRLSVSERQTFFHQAVYNMFVYLLLWAIQVLISYLLCQYYISLAPANILSNQTVFLAFYRNQLLHGLLPLSEGWLWIRNGIFILSLSFAAAEFPFKQRRKKFGASMVALCIYTIFMFAVEIGWMTGAVSSIVVGLVVIGEMLYTVLQKEDYYEA